MLRYTSMDFEKVSRLVHDIYDLDSNSERWRHVLARIADVCEVEVASVASGTRSQQISICCSGTDIALLREYPEKWAPFDPTLPLMIGARPGDIMSLADVGGAEVFRRTVVGAEFWPQTGHSPEHLRAKIHHDADSWMLFAVNARLRDNEITNHAAKAFSLFIPHVTRAAEIQRRLRQAFLGDRPAAMAAGSPGAFLVDGAGRVLFYDQAAEDILEARNGVSLHAGQIALASVADTRTLDRLIASCGKFDAGRSTPGGRLSVRAPHAIDVEVLPIFEGSGSLGLEMLGRARPAALVLIDDRTLQDDRLLLRLRHSFGLTPAEALVALETTRSDGRKEIARALGLSEHTVRTHLTRIFEKTGAPRQATLVRMVLETGLRK